jgi:hypothetical protein
LAIASTLLTQWRAAPKAARLCVIAVLPVLLIVLAAAWLLDGDETLDPDQRAVVAALRSFEKAVRDQDVEAVQSLTSEQFYRDYLRLSGSASIFADSDPALALGRPVERRVENVTISGDTATIAATVNGDDARNVDAVEVRLQRSEAAWLVSGLAPRKTGPKSGSQVVEVTMRDHTFAPDPLFVRAGTPVVFRVRNSGAQPHMMAIWAVPRGSDLILIIEATGAVPPGVERIVQGTTFAAGNEGDVTVPRGFKRGRYMLSCFLSDITSEELTPHYDLGMLTEFEVK